MCVQDGKTRRVVNKWPGREGLSYCPERLRGRWGEACRHSQITASESGLSKSPRKYSFQIFVHWLSNLCTRVQSLRIINGKGFWRWSNLFVTVCLCYKQNPNLKCWNEFNQSLTKSYRWFSFMALVTIVQIPFLYDANNVKELFNFMF